VANQSAEEQGWGVQLTARFPVGPAQVWVHGWYTSGDDTRAPNGVVNAVLTKDSDKLPLVIAGTSWLSVPYVAEFITGNRTIGAPAIDWQ